ncbi:penicillin-binding transpeptidase domain-containing protein [Verrucomicrobium sp. BvORR106]|uniref:penicillin-binding transpeptidase domain-containing protein n=1 Tax=Verrucomicrobium sp. BvORR106 TaxID=1403819 RepID=UPI00056F8DFE|nr:penicillin-binding transpeptidase domain-containing protein [Verrucomicrobium sp. BvORR106]
MVVKYRFRLYLFTVVILIGFGALSQRLWNLSIDHHEELKNKVPGTKNLRARIPGSRGEIRDRNGVVLVSNKPSFEVRVNLKTLVEEYTKQARAEKRDVPLYTYKYTEGGIPRSKDETDIVTIVNEGIIEPLNKLGLAADFNAKKLRIHYRTNRGVVPWVYRSDLTFEEFSRFAEHRLGLPGISVEVRPVRQYLFDSFACHVLGYVNQPDVQQASKEEINEWDFFVPDDYGVYGVEKTFDQDLRGKAGMRIWLQNEKGRLVKEVDYQEPRKGHDVYLAIDARIQMIAEKALREGTPAIGRGAVVVLDPSTGQVLAMASVPSYNPNKFIPSISKDDFAGYLENPCVPLLNRSVRGFVPGSTYKIMTSFAGILAGVEGDMVNCPGGIQFGGKFMKCWIGQKGGAHGTLGLSEAIMRSCNCYFYRYANHAGNAAMTKAGDMFGLGQRTGIELEEEAPGILPVERWWRVNKTAAERFSEASIANMAIGQGAVEASPLQMAGVAAAVGNGGIAYRPHLLNKVMDGTELIREQMPDVRANFKDFGLTPQKLELVRRGMWRVVNDQGGTAKAAKIAGTEVAGKTGTAQNWRKNGKEFVKDNHTLFITFAPYENPKFAACILVQGGKGGGVTAAPVAKRILEQALALDKGYEVELAKVNEVQGNFNPVDTVSYDGLPTAFQPGTEEEEAVVDNDDEPRRSAKREDAPKARPTIRDEADAEGTKQNKNQAPPPRRANFLKRLFGRDG